MATLTNLQTRHKPGVRSGPAARFSGLVLMTDETRAADPGAAIAALPPGSIVVFRHYGAADRAGRAARIRRLCRTRRLLFLVAGDWRLARRLGADGLHLPEHMAARGPGPWRLNRRPGAIVTAAAHSRRALHRAFRAGADWALLSPVFATESAGASKPGRTPLGPVRFAATARLSPLPVLALGGIGPATARRLAGTGAIGVAGVGGIARLAENPAIPRPGRPRGGR